MKVLHVLASNKYSGAENVACQIIKMFDGEIEMAYCSPDGLIRNALLERNIAFLPIKKLSKKELKRAIKEYQPDIIHAHDMRASFVVAKAVKKRPFISHIHNNAFDSRAISLKSIAYLCAAKKARRIFWVTESAYQGYKFHNLFKGKSTILYNIIDIERLYEKLQEDKNSYAYDIVYVGRLAYEKNPQRLMEVLCKVTQKDPKVKIAIVGTGELEREVKELSRSLGIEKNVEFLGFQNNPLKIMHDAKVMIMTSRWEGVPMCAIEAMALGLPIVSTPTDGLKALIEDGVNGFLSEDDEKLAERIMSILLDCELYQKLSVATKRKGVQRNRVQPYKQMLVECYKGILINL